jgi:two-component system copper resistance phosphate regulon response regulator CusR
MKIILAEDELKLASFIKKGLEHEGFELDVVHDGKIALEYIAKQDYHLAILDINLPNTSGFELCKILKKKNPYTAILFLTALDSLEDKEEGFNSGGDDYLVKPFEFKELLLRIRALGRRIAVKSDSVLALDDLFLNRITKEVTRNNKKIELTQKEHQLLEYFMLNIGRTISRVEISENVWELFFDTQTNIVEVYISYLRKKIDKNFTNKLLHTVVGAGYVLENKAC